MIVLAIDTALDACQAALTDAGKVRFSRSEPMHRGHQERLAPLLAEAMAATGARFAELERIGVTTGPGSFTGLRVGLAFVKGLALACGVPCVGIGVLEALAASLPQSAGRVLAVIDAKRGQVYLQLFQDGGPASPPEAVLVGDVGAWLDQRGGRRRLTLVGSGASLLSDVVAPDRVVDLAAPDPLAVARLAERAPEPDAMPRPLYLRPPDARPTA